MKLKLIFCVIICNMLYPNLCAQKYSKDFKLECDTLTQTGYFVTIYEKDIIKELIKNKKRKQENKPYELIFLLSGLNISFVPIDSIENSNKFLTLMNNHFTNNSLNVYTMYQSLNDADYKFLRGLDTEFASQWPNIISSDYYELVRGKSKFCFQILFLTAQWVRIKVPSLEEAYNLVGRKAQYLKKNENYYEIYVLKEVISYDTNLKFKDSPIKLWRRL